MTDDRCLVCPDAALAPISASDDDIAFFECPSCGRPYAREAGGSLTFRWPHPLALPLYAVLFEKDPVSRAGEVARRFRASHPMGELRRMAGEIERELADPTQEVRAVVDNPQPEDVCREFLGAFASELRERIEADVPGRDD